VTKAAVPHIILNSFKNLASVTFETEYSFPQADKMKEAAKKAATAVSAPKADAKGGKKEEKAKEPEPKKEEEADVGVGGLFGDDGY